MKKVLLIDNYDSFTYNLVHYIEAVGEYHVDVFRNDEIELEEVASYNTIILSPGPGLPKDSGILLPLIKQYAPTKKILGVCLGMQAIFEAYGGSLTNLSCVFHGVATPVSILQPEDPLFFNLPKSFKVGRYHSWVVDPKKLPKDFYITSTDEEGNIMSISHKTHRVYGVQFHPESVLTQYGKKIITNFLTC